MNKYGKSTQIPLINDGSGTALFLFSVFFLPVCVCACVCTEMVYLIQDLKALYSVSINMLAWF